MEYLGIGVFVVVLIGGCWLLSRLMTTTGRNDGPTYGGGFGDRTSGIEDDSDSSSTND